MCTDTDPLESTYSELGGTLAPFPAKSDLESIFQDARGGLWPNTRCSTENTRHGWLAAPPAPPAKFRGISWPEFVEFGSKLARGKGNISHRA